MACRLPQHRRLAARTLLGDTPLFESKATDEVSLHRQEMADAVLLNKPGITESDIAAGRDALSALRSGGSVSKAQMDILIQLATKKRNPRANSEPNKQL